jgi:flavin-dependent dehydrogenase
VEKARIYAPNGRYILAKIKKNYVVCRKKFDSYLGNMAKDAGVNIKLGHSFHGFTNGSETTSVFSSKDKDIKSKADIIIGADGPLSPVAKSAKMFGKRQMLIGTQIEAYMKNDNVVEFYPYIGSYAWIVPVNKEVVRIGVAGYKDNVSLFKEFAKKRLGKDYDEKTIENQSGIIPLFNPKLKIQSDNVYILGDSGTFLKATTGGGINQGLKAAEILANDLGSYEKNVRRKLYPNLYVHLIAHEMMKKFSNEDWNMLIEEFSHPRLKKILYSESRDNIIKMMMKIMINKPSLIRYVKHFPVRLFLSTAAELY